MKETKAESV